MAIFIPIQSDRNARLMVAKDEVNDVTIVGLSKNHGRCRDECQVSFIQASLVFIGIDENTLQVHV